MVSLSLDVSWTILLLTKWTYYSFVRIMADRCNYVFVCCVSAWWFGNVGGKLRRVGPCSIGRASGASFIESVIVLCAGMVWCVVYLYFMEWCALNNMVINKFWSEFWYIVHSSRERTALWLQACRPLWWQFHDHGISYHRRLRRLGKVGLWVLLEW